MTRSKASVTEPPLSVGDVLAFDDAELAEYMQRHRRPDGGFELDDIDGWDALTAVQRDELAEKLKFGAQKADEAMQSRPVNADQVAARLLKISTGQDAASQLLPRPSRFERSPTAEVDPNEEMDEMRKFEAAAYTDLVNDGGRPAYPIELLEKVSEDPESYRGILLPWQEYPNSDTVQWNNVFQRQLGRWRDFRLWQKDNRGILDEKAEFLAFVDTEDKALAVLGLSRQRMWPRESESQHQESLQSTWGTREVKRIADHRKLREGRKYADFAEYADQVKQRLSRHGFPRPFALLRDPRQQDPLSTWIEYLGYEYAWLDLYARSVERLEQKGNEAWAKLRESGVLQHHETAEFLRSAESSIQHQAELDQARGAVSAAENAARAAITETEKAQYGRSRLTSQDRMKSLSEAQSRLTAARDELKETTRRLDLVSAFVRGQHPCLEAKRNHLRQQLLVQWILDQVPRIAGSLNGPQHNQASSVPISNGDLAGKNPRKRGRPNDTTNDEQPSKRPTKRPSPAAPEPPAPRRSARLAAKHAAPPPPFTTERPSPTQRQTRRSAPAPKIQASNPRSRQSTSKAKTTPTGESSAGVSKPKRAPRKRKAGQ